MKNKIAALICTLIIALFVFSATFAIVNIIGFDIKPIEGSERTQNEATLIGSAFISIFVIGLFYGCNGLINTFSWFNKEFEKRDNLDLD